MIVRVASFRECSFRVCSLLFLASSIVATACSSNTNASAKSVDGSTDGATDASADASSDAATTDAQLTVTDGDAWALPARVSCSTSPARILGVATDGSHAADLTLEFTPHSSTDWTGTYDTAADFPPQGTALQVGDMFKAWAVKIPNAGSNYPTLTITSADFGDGGSDCTVHGSLVFTGVPSTSTPSAGPIGVSMTF